MIKTLFAGLLLFIAMVSTAVVVSHKAKGDEQYTVTAETHAYSQPATKSILDASYQPVATYGEGGGWEDNRFMIVAGLTLILCFAVGFWKYHQILEDRRNEEEAAQAAQHKSARFKRGDGRKELPV